jgi:hypothetical protein
MATYTSTLISKMALSHLGTGLEITDITDPTKEGRLCSLWYEPCRDKVLEDFAWPFATKYATLGLVQEDPNDDWDYEYRMPADCLAARRIVGAVGPMDPNPPPFDQSSDASGLLIWTDVEDAVLVYTAQFTDAGLFSSAFADALAWRMAIVLADPLSAKPERMQVAEKAYEKAINTAMANAANSRQMHPQPISPFLGARS